MIAGATVGSVIGVTLIFGFLLLFFLRRRKQKRQKENQASQDTKPQPVVEKAQLHSDDYKPERTELLGDQPGVKRKPVPPAEMAANENPVRITSEMSANEIVASDLQSKELSSGSSPMLQNEKLSGGRSPVLEGKDAGSGGKPTFSIVRKPVNAN